MNPQKRRAICPYRGCSAKSVIDKLFSAPFRGRPQEIAPYRACSKPRVDELFLEKRTVAKKPPPDVG